MYEKLIYINNKKKTVFLFSSVLLEFCLKLYNFKKTKWTLLDCNNSHISRVPWNYLKSLSIRNLMQCRIDQASGDSIRPYLHLIHRLKEKEKIEATTRFINIHTCLLVRFITSAYFYRVLQLIYRSLTSWLCTLIPMLLLKHANFFFFLFSFFL